MEHETRSKWLAAVLGSMVCLLSGVWAGNAAGQEDASPKDPKAEFEEGMRLLHQAQYDEACERFERSLRLAYVGGSVLALARCRQLQGRQASAWQTFLAARDIALRDGRDDRVSEADERIAEIAPHLSRLAVIPPPDPPAGLTLLRNGATIESNSWGIAVPVDGGGYQIEARAPGMLPWTSNVEVAQVDDRATVRVPKMRPAPRVQIMPPPGPPRGLVILWDGAGLEPSRWGTAVLTSEGDHALTARAAGYKPWHALVHIEASMPSKTVSIPALERTGEQPARAPLPAMVYVAGVVGVAGLGVGTWFGVDALRKRHEVESMCPDLARCAEGKELNDRAGRAADIATAGFAIGLAGAGVAAYFLLARPLAGQTVQSASIALVPGIGPRSAGVWVSGAAF